MSDSLPPIDCSTPGFPVHHQLQELAQTHVHRLSDAIQPSHPLLPPSPLAFNPSQHQGLSQWVSSFVRWPKYWSFNFSITMLIYILSSEYSGLISFRIDWFKLLAVQGTLKSLLQHHSSKASVLQCSVFFMVQLSHPYVTTGKTIALTMWTFDRKVMSLLFNMLSRFVIAFLARSKRLLISWLQSPSSVILKPKKIKSVTASTFPPFCLSWSNGTEYHDLSFFNVEFQISFSLSSFIVIKRLFSSSSLSSIRVGSFAYVKLLLFLLAIWIPACDSSSSAFGMIYSAYKLNKQADNILFLQFWTSQLFHVRFLQEAVTKIILFFKRRLFPFCH